MTLAFKSFLRLELPNGFAWNPLLRGSLAVSPKMEATQMEILNFPRLPGSTSYPYLPLRTIDPPDTHSHPQVGVQIYEHPNLLQKKRTQKFPPTNSDFYFLRT